MTSKPAVMAGHAPTVKMLLDGQFIESRSNEWHDVVNPATQEVLAQVPFATDEELNAAVASAKRAYDSWKNTPLAARARIMLKLQALVREHMSRIAQTLSAEQGKTLADAEGDVFRGLEVVEHACSIGTLQLGEFAENVAGGVDTYTLRQPIGVCAGISPFNFPAMIPLWMFPMAIVCGNTFVLKPSEQDPMTPMLLAELALEAGVPPGVLNIVHGGKRTVDGICAHPDIAAVSFVGSTAVGTHVYGLASTHGKRVQCMMGAKNHAVVMPDANKEQSLNSLVGATFGAAGQRCMAGSVLVLVGAARERLLPALVKRAGGLKVGPGSDETVELGPVISAAARDRIASAIERAAEEGAELLLDGRATDAGPAGTLLGPTILGAVDPASEAVAEEIFGPVLTVIEVATLEDAIATVNSSRFGNGASIFTESGAAVRAFRRDVEAGMIGVNIGVAAPVAFFPFSGWKDSFLGDLHAHGPDAVEFYTRKKTVTSRWFGAGESGAYFVER